MFNKVEFSAFGCDPRQHFSVQSISGDARGIAPLRSSNSPQSSEIGNRLPLFFGLSITGQTPEYQLEV